MKKIIQQLKKVGVHVIENNFDIGLEFFHNGLDYSNEIDTLIDELITATEENGSKRILVECPATLLHRLSKSKERMRIVGERVIYTRKFSKQLDIKAPSHEIWSPSEPRALIFLSEVMGVEIKEAEKFLSSMKTELPSQVNRMFTVYIIDGEPVGLVFPHIEPDTNQEGRMFWIGVHPKHLGKGHGKALHRIGLSRLQKEFYAKSYLGATKKGNLPMRRIMQSNGCQQSENSMVSLEYIQ
ncbi:GNAT family N-acetyltransferase [Virgibacillus phasianinus]|uniref:GNAT family N-acetyltransferase n=1 Tax=Virgibacillus phasianinus TaxID=2017483 RepID=A0A220U7S5_9BACI|nr:GNAT family N-acetyltransferase [Virgibacillus phasianinus]ASK63946.1 GNAT family N-acetyltransferase [Virgibacillus phasianinus]